MQSEFFLKTGVSSNFLSLKVTLFNLILKFTIFQLFYNLLIANNVTVEQSGLINEIREPLRICLLLFLSTLGNCLRSIV